MKRLIIYCLLIIFPFIINGQKKEVSYNVKKTSSKEKFKSQLTNNNHKGCNHVSPIKPVIPDNVAKIMNGEFTQPLFCPKGEKLIYTNSKGNALYYQQSLKHVPVILSLQSGVGNNVGWSKSSELIYFKEKTKDYRMIVKSLNLKTKEVKEYPYYPKLIDLSSLSISDTIYYLNEQTLAVQARCKGKTWNITTEEGNYYKILISPDNKYLAVHKSTDVLLFTTDGQFVKNFGKGIATSWSPDSKYLVGFIDESSDGHNITGSDLLLFNIEEGTTLKITSTKNAFEMWPSFKNKNEIVYTDQLNNGLFSMPLNK